MSRNARRRHRTGLSGTRARLRLFAFSLLAVAALAGGQAAALPPETLDSVVSVLPVWPGKPQGGGDLPPGTAPEGSGVVIDEDGVIVTAWHVVAPAERIDVRLADGRVLPAQLIGADRASDIALLRVEARLPTLPPAPRPAIADPACAIGNVYGLGLSVTCGVISALDVSDAGFNAVEDFVQTDAAANPGSSGGALVDKDGRLVGMVSAIFASQGDSNIGVNFAISARLLTRVVADLRDDGAVDYVSAGWRLERLTGPAASETAGARVAGIEPAGAAAAAGVETGDILLSLGDRQVRKPRDAVAALALVAPGSQTEGELLRDGERRSVFLHFPIREAAPPASTLTASPDPDCPHPQPVCATRQAVFPVESFDPAASAVRIAEDLLVTNRHVVADRKTATVFTPDGALEAQVIASAYRGDLALLQISGLPDGGVMLEPEERRVFDPGPYFSVGADVARREIRVFEPGSLIAAPAEDAPLGRIHVTARMQPGVSGGALIDGEGKLIGIAVGGGEGRFEALPAGEIAELLAGRDAPEAASVHAELGAALAACAVAIEGARNAARGQPLEGSIAGALTGDCREGENLGQFLEAGRLLGMSGDFASAIVLHDAAVTQVPNSANARISLLVSLQLAGRFPEMLPHARRLLELAPEDPQAHRFAIQAGVWGGDEALAEAAYLKLLEVDPRQAEAARRFIDSPPPAPQPR